MGIINYICKKSNMENYLYWQQRAYYELERYKITKIKKIKIFIRDKIIICLNNCNAIIELIKEEMKDELNKIKLNTKIKINHYNMNINHLYLDDELKDNYEEISNRYMDFIKNAEIIYKNIYGEIYS